VLACFSASLSQSRRTSHEPRTSGRGKSVDLVLAPFGPARTNSRREKARFQSRSLKISFKKLVCDDQGSERPTEIPIAGSNCIIDSGLVGVVRSWWGEVKSHDFPSIGFLFRDESRTCPYALGFVATMVIHLIHRDQPFDASCSVREILTHIRRWFIE
jgi:hypothetical protein